MENQKPIFATKTLLLYNTKDKLEMKVKYSKKVAIVTPATPYHRRKNQQLRKGYRFIVVNGEIEAQKYDEDAETWVNISSNQVRYKKTHQYKTTWYSRGSRRK